MEISVKQKNLCFHFNYERSIIQMYKYFSQHGEMCSLLTENENELTLQEICL